MEILQALLPWLQIILALAITAAVLLQRNDASLGGVFGGSGNISQTKRGLEKGLFVTTIVLAALFIISSIAALLIHTV